MKIVTSGAAVGVLLVMLLAGTAHADGHPYTNPDTPVLPAEDAETTGGGGDEVDGEVLDNEADATSTGGGDTAVEGGEAEGAEIVGGPAAAEVVPAAAVASAPTAPSGSLPVTGGDVIGLSVIGAAALGLGTVLVRRSKAMRSQTA